MASIPEQILEGSNVNEGVLCIPQSSSITGISQSDCLMSYQWHSLEEGSCPSAEMQLVYYTVLAVKAKWDFVISSWTLLAYLVECFFH